MNFSHNAWKAFACSFVVVATACSSSPSGSADVGVDSSVIDDGSFDDQGQSGSGDATVDDDSGRIEVDAGDPVGDAGGSGDAGVGADPLACDPLPMNTEHTVVEVGPDDAANLPQIVREAGSGTTILLDDGTYAIDARLQFRNPNVTLRSKSNDAEAVIIDSNYGVDEMFWIVASDVTVAHVTVRRAENHLIHVTPFESGDVTGTMLYGLRLLDGGEQFIKVNQNGDRTAFVDDGLVECSYFQLTDEGRPNIERNPGGCYTGGVDNHSTWRWTIRNNTFRDIYCAGEGLAEHAIHFWSASRDTVVENNTIINCARGIGFGLVENGNERAYPDDPYPDANGYIGHYDGIIRNNVIVADIPWYDTGVELAQAKGARVYHNTVFSTDAATGFYSSIDYRFGETDADIRNNIVRRITRRNDATGQVENNLEGPAADIFVDVASYDLHLDPGATDAIDQGVQLDDSGVDIDGQPRDIGAGPDIGADEHGG